LREINVEKEAVILQEKEALFMLFMCEKVDKIKVKKVNELIPSKFMIFQLDFMLKLVGKFMNN